MGATPGAAVAPPLLERARPAGAEPGRARRRDAAHAAQAGRRHRRQVAHPRRQPVTLTIVGTATLPPIGVAGLLAPRNGHRRRARLPAHPARRTESLRGHAGAERHPRPDEGRGQRAALRSLQAIGRRVDIADQRGLRFRACSRPAQILNYGSLGTTPALLGAALAAGAAAALGITLVTSVRRRRHDLAILKTLGFTRAPARRRRRRAGGVAAVIGCAVGNPRRHRAGPGALGPVRRRDQRGARTRRSRAGPSSSSGPVALALAVLVATIPGRLAARTPTSQLLRAE